MRRTWWLGVAAILAGTGWMETARADVRLPAIIGNNMVLQADKPLPIWGWAEPGEDVTVTLGEAKAAAKADAKGDWSVKLPAQKASATAAEMTVAGKNSIKLSNILVGEVWAGSGQSNMQWSVSQSANKDQEIQAADFPQIRLFLVPNVLSAKALSDVNAAWVVCSPQTIPNFTAVLYYFGREIHQDAQCPGRSDWSLMGGLAHRTVDHLRAVRRSTRTQARSRHLQQAQGRSCGIAQAISGVDQGLGRSCGEGCGGRPGNPRSARHSRQPAQSIHVAIGNVQRHGPRPGSLRPARISLVPGRIQSRAGDALCRFDEGADHQLAGAVGARRTCRSCMCNWLPMFMTRMRRRSPKSGKRRLRRWRSRTLAWP